MTVPYPPHTALLGETDLHIKTLAYATDSKLAAYTQSYGITGTAAVDANGDIVLTFPTAKTLTGVIVQPAGFVYADGQQRNFPPPYAADAIPRTFVKLVPRQYGAGGLVWVKVMTSPVKYSFPRWYGSQPAAAGTSVPYVAFGWA